MIAEAPRPAAAVVAGAAYFGVVFAAGFMLGTARVLLLAPRFGDFAAVALELPVMLAISWFACGWLLGRLAVPPRATSRLAMGGVALALLVAAEVALSALAFGRGPVGYLESLATAEGGLGLAGQLAFALFPLLRLRVGPRAG